MSPERDIDAAPRQHMLFAVFTLLLIWLPIPMGSNRPAAIALFVAVAGCLLAAWAWQASLTGPHPRVRWHPAVRWALFLWVIWLLWIGCQLIPLPMSVLEALSPASAQIHQALPNPSRLATLSIAPAHTIQQLLLSAALFATYLLTIVLAHGRRRTRWILQVIVFTALLQAAYGLFMTLSGLEYGFLERKRYGLGLTTGTFVNRNHLASYLLLGLSAGIALMLSQTPLPGQSWKARLRYLLDLLLSGKLTLRLILMIMVIALVMTRSRMGNIAFFAALCIGGTLWMVIRERSRMLRPLLFFLSLLVVDVLVISNWFGLQRLVDRLESTELTAETRWMQIEEYRPVVETYLWTGAGLGNFSLAYAPYQRPDLDLRYEHAHNDYAQFLIETGVVGILILAAFVCLHLWHALKVLINRRRTLPAAVAFSALMALLSIGFHSFAEFCLQIPAIAAGLIVLLALAIARSGHSTAPRDEKAEEPASTSAETGAVSHNPS